MTLNDFMQYGMILLDYAVLAICVRFLYSIDKNDDDLDPRPSTVVTCIVALIAGIDLIVRSLSTITI